MSVPVIDPPLFNPWDFATPEEERPHIPKDQRKAMIGPCDVEGTEPKRK